MVVGNFGARESGQVNGNRKFGSASSEGLLKGDRGAGDVTDITADEGQRTERVDAWGKELKAERRDSSPDTSRTVTV